MAAPGARHWEQDKEATVYIGNLDERVTDQLVWELMLQAGRIQNVHLPKDRVTQSHQGFGFVEFMTEQDADYAAKIMNQVRLFGKPVRVNKASADKQKTIEIGAELFVGNLDVLVDEKALFDTFSRFGDLCDLPKIARSDEGLSKGYGFVSYVDFEASDAAIEAMNGQFMMNKEITVQYAYKKDGKGERHGDEAERRLAAQAKANGVLPPPVQVPPQWLPGFGFPPGAAQAAPQGMMMNGDGSGRPPIPPIAHNTPAPYSRPPPASLPPAPSGLPARPPPGAGLNGPPGFYAQGPGFPGPPPPQGFPGGPPPGFPGQGPPPGFPPQGIPPPGFPRR